MSVSYLTPTAHPVAVGAAGRGSIAIETILAGDVVAAFGGRCVTRVEFDLLPVAQQVRSIQIEDALFLAGPTEPEPADFINHSCDPTCGMRGATVLVALRDLEAGEAITYDYATTDGSDYDEFECACGSVLCRGKVTGYDWMLPELQLRHRGSFSPYLAARTAALARIRAERRALAS